MPWCEVVGNNQDFLLAQNLHGVTSYCPIEWPPRREKRIRSIDRTVEHLIGFPRTVLAVVYITSTLRALFLAVVR